METLAELLGVAAASGMRGNIVKGHVRAIKDDKIAAEGEITFALIDRPNELDNRT